MDPAHLERLGMTTEEGGKIYQAVGQDLRFGPYNRSPAHAQHQDGLVVAFGDYGLKVPA